MKTRFGLIGLFAFLLLMFASSAHAILPAVSPATGADGFPLWYQDGNGVALAPCLTDSPTGTPCVLLADTFFNPLLPAVFPTNFPTEFFYWIADADFATTINVPAVKKIRFALEGSFANVPPSIVAGQQAVFARIRIRITPPDPNGTYIVTHPFGSITFAPPFDPKKGINDTVDVPLPAPLDFTSALNSAIGPFLVWDPIADAPPGFIGDPLVLHAVTGSPAGNNFVRIDGPSIGGPGVNTVQSNMFNVAGQIAQTGAPLATPLLVDRATFSRTTTAGQVDVFAHSAATAIVTAAAGPNFPAGPQALTGDGFGSFTGHVVLVPNGSVVPVNVTLTSSNPPNVDVVVTQKVVDLVTVTLAEYNPTSQTLTIQASSSDQGTIPPTLTAAGGTLTGGSLVLTGVAVAPSTVIVSSSAGGSATVQPAIITATTEVITISSAQFRTGIGEWNVQGTTTAPNSRLTLTLGTPQGALILRTTADATGRWRVRTPTSSAVPTAANNKVVVSSNSGAVATATVTIRN